MYNRYGRLASWVYHLDKPIGHSFGDIEFYQERLKGLRGSILEPAVGNGRVYIPLLQAGFDVYGFDASEEMLALCRDECLKGSIQPKISQQKFESFSYNNLFEALIIPAGSFQLITDRSIAIRTLQRFHQYLTPGGRLIMDLDPVGSILSAPSTSVRSWTTPDEDLLVLSEQRLSMCYIAQTVSSHLRYEHWREGALIRNELDVFTLRWWGVEEFVMTLQAAGFDEVQVSGNYQYGKAPEENDSIITFEALRD